MKTFVTNNDQAQATALDDSLSGFFAGFELAAQRRADGKLYSYTKGEINELADWPKEIAAFGNIYGLENVVKGVDGYEGAVYA